MSVYPPIGYQLRNKGKPEAIAAEGWAEAAFPAEDNFDLIARNLFLRRLSNPDWR